MPFIFDTNSSLQYITKATDRMSQFCYIIGTCSDLEDILYEHDTRVNRKAHYHILFVLAELLLASKKLGSIGIEQIIKYHKYLLVCKYLKNEKLVYSLRQVVSEKLQIPKAKPDLCKKAFACSGPKLWNELPVLNTACFSS